MVLVGCFVGSSAFAFGLVFDFLLRIVYLIVLPFGFSAWIAFCGSLVLCVRFWLFRFVVSILALAGFGVYSFLEFQF